jgi:hypothetical protein
MNPQDLLEQLNRPVDDPETDMDTTIEEAITIYLLARSSSDAFAQVADAAEQVIADVMKDLGSTVYTTQADVVVLDFGGHLEFVGAK